RPALMRVSTAKRVSEEPHHVRPRPEEAGGGGGKECAASLRAQQRLAPGGRAALPLTRTSSWHAALPLTRILIRLSSLRSLSGDDEVRDPEAPQWRVFDYVHHVAEEATHQAAFGPVVTP